MAAQVALIIPALNEEETLGAVLEQAQRFALAQILVVDNGSQDRTSEVARAAGAQVLVEPRRGYGNACLAGIAALRPDIEILLFIDADGSDDPSDIPRLLAPIECGEADFVLGSRTLGRPEPGALAPQQQFGNWVATRLMRLLFGARYTDLGPLRAIRRDALERLAMRDTNFGWTIEMQIKARRHGLRVREIPVNYRKRRGGQSKISGTLSGSFLAGAKILWTVLRHQFFE